VDTKGLEMIIHRTVAVLRKGVGVILIACLLPLLSGMALSVWSDSNEMSVKGQVAVEKININTAPQDKLIKLKRIGLVIAGRIIEYREKHGPFQKPEDIMKVRGIGQKTWEDNKNVITVE
jgi:competence protein ComEA